MIAQIKYMNRFIVLTKADHPKEKVKTMVTVSSAPSIRNVVLKDNFTIDDLVHKISAKYPCPSRTLSENF